MLDLIEKYLISIPFLILTNRHLDKSTSAYPIEEAIGNDLRELERLNAELKAFKSQLQSKQPQQ